MNIKKYSFKILFIGAWLLLSFGVKALQLSPQAQISLITVSPGAELYSMYGHSAIRVLDPTQSMDVVFNYGTFNFNTPNFYVKFVQGKLPYQLSAGYYQDLVNHSMEDNRSVYEQVLNLTLPEKQAVMNFLENNYLPENRSYLYDFFHDNCATRIRDVFGKNMPQRLQYKKEKPGKPLSFRQMVGIYQAPHPWVDLGVDLVMGLPSDRLTDSLAYMFLPDYLLMGFNQAKVLGPPTAALGTGTDVQPFVKEINQVFKASAPPTGSTLITPTVFFWLLFVLVALTTFWQLKQRKTGYSLDILLFALTGLLGCILLFLWFGTDHQSFTQNLNILWAFPLHLPVAFLLLRHRKPEYIKFYFLGTALVLVLISITWKLLPQEFHPAVYPIVLLLAIRAWYISRSHQNTRRTVNINS
jgi:hypothetical protein